MSAAFQLRKAFGGWTLVGSVNTPSRSTAIANNEVYLYSTDTSNSVSISNSPLGRPAVSTPTYSMENWLYLKTTKAPSGKCNNFRVWYQAAPPATGVKFFLYSTAYAKYHTPEASTSHGRCLRSATAFYSISVSTSVPGQITAVGSCSGYFVIQARIYSTANVGEISGANLNFHYSYDES